MVAEGRQGNASHAATRTAQTAVIGASPISLTGIPVANTLKA